MAELSTKQISETEKAEGFGQNEIAARKGGQISGDARKALEAQVGKKVVNGENYLKPGEEVGKLE